MKTFAKHAVLAAPLLVVLCGAAPADPPAPNAPLVIVHDDDTLEVVPAESISPPAPAPPRLDLAPRVTTLRGFPTPVFQRNPEAYPIAMAHGLPQAYPIRVVPASPPRTSAQPYLVVPAPETRPPLVLPTSKRR